MRIDKPLRYSRTRIARACKFGASAERCGAWTVIALVWSGAIFGDDRVVPYVGLLSEYNSNIFALPGHAEALAENGDRRLDDTSISAIAGLDANLPWDNEKLSAKIEGRRLDYLHFGRLDHNEYLLSSGFDWRLLSIFDGALNFRQERSMASFADRDTTELSLQRERTGSGSVNAAISPEWRLETGLRTHALAAPLSDSPNFNLNENAASTAIKYLGIDKFTAGVFAEYLAGKYEGVGNAGKFEQETVALTADYLIKDFQHFGAQVGYTTRKDKSADGGSLSGLDAIVNYHRDLTIKTSADIEAFRHVDSYIGGASSVEEIGAGTKLAWQATTKISLTGEYQYLDSQFKQTGAQSINQNRHDQMQVAYLRLLYKARPWLLLRTYAEYQSRGSNIERDNFDAALLGIEVIARLQ